MMVNIVQEALIWFDSKNNTEKVKLSSLFILHFDRLMMLLLKLYNIVHFNGSPTQLIIYCVCRCMSYVLGGTDYLYSANYYNHLVLDIRVCFKSPPISPTTPPPRRLHFMQFKHYYNGDNCADWWITRPTRILSSWMFLLGLVGRRQKERSTWRYSIHWRIDSSLSRNSLNGGRQLNAN